MKLALVTCESLAQYAAADVEDEDALLTRFLRSRGHDITPEVWTNPAVNWAGYDALLLKSPWDYFDRVQEFYAWLDQLDQAGVRMLNPVPTVRWNADKKYLAEMEQAGVRIVPTRWLLRGARFEPEQLFETLGTEKLIVKPAVSGGAKNTFALTRAEAQAAIDRLDSLLYEEDFLAQPFLPQIQTQGEWSFIYLGGQFSHCVLKTPKSGDFRVQHYLGGGIEPHPAPPHLLAVADGIVQKFAADCLYARVDGVEAGSEFLLMELELIEPFLYLASDPGALDRYEAGLRRMLG
ncbi:hypothetical protein LJY25_20685 [Hymenobacter sp. BT175]|uniref:ATP-grasp domain-containing protein n=1 Tax=Hymenobacter translucens TaxID=2886507 RepID=UPI001D0E0E17|nr:hypothetical protein [Hymenobacter translucens]MCC2548878.1 hypothetical protein [Hymenobacter translucens]